MEWLWLAFIREGCCQGTRYCCIYLGDNSEILLEVLWEGCSGFHLNQWMSYWIWILNFRVWLEWKVTVVIGESYVFFPSFVLIDLNSLDDFFLNDNWVKLSAIRLAIYFSFVAFVFVSLRKIYKVPNYFYISIGVYFWGEGFPRGSFGFIFWCYIDF